MLQRLVSAVQPTDARRELWVFRKSGAKWTIGVLPPADSGPDVGYAEFAGWVPRRHADAGRARSGGQR
jgi:hypothetical protein